MEIIQQALAANQHAVNEHEAKKILADYGIATTREALARDRAEALAAAAEIGYPVVVKGSGAQLLHKSESGVVFVNLDSEAAVKNACDRIAQQLGDEFAGVLVQEMVSGKRELVVGLHREPQFGPCVMLGIGGVLTELLNDTAFRIAPFDEAEAKDMADDLRARKILDPFRGEAAADMNALCRSLTAVGRLGAEQPAISEIDINPLIITPGGGIKAVDALIVLKDSDNDTDNGKFPSL